MQSDTSNSNIAIIPARGGSKRIPLKNIKPFMGKPAILYPIETALAIGVIEQIIVSTDSDLIADCVNGIEKVKVHMRPSNLSDDLTPTVPVIAEAINSTGIGDDVAVCCIYPVNPFIQSNDIAKGLNLLRQNPGISYVNSIGTYSYPIQRAVRKKANGTIEMLNPELALTRSQDLEEAFHDAGQWYWGRAKTWKNGDKLLFNSIGVQIPRWRCQDIDTNEDWELSELLYKVSKNGAQGLE